MAKSRAKYEREIASALVLLFGDYRQQWEGSQSFNRSGFRSAVASALSGKLAPIYTDAAVGVVLVLGIMQDEIDATMAATIHANAQKWEASFLPVLAENIASTTVPGQEGAFSVQRAQNVAISETTRATEMAKRAIVTDAKEKQGTKFDALWITHPERTMTGPCPICEPLHNQPESVWSGRFRDGPPAHSRCECEIEYRLVAA